MAKTRIGFLLDETGSMSVIRDQTVDGTKEYLKKLKSGKGIRLTMMWFNSDVPRRMVYDNAKVKDLDMSVLDKYDPASTTPLYDALGGIIKYMEKRVKKKDKVLVVVMTDGLENASIEYTQKQIFEMVKEKKKEGWEFAFLGADIDSFAVGGSVGVSRGSTVNFDKGKIVETMAAVADVSVAYAAGETESGRLFEDAEGDWKVD